MFILITYLDCNIDKNNISVSLKKVGIDTLLDYNGKTASANQELSNI